MSEPDEPTTSENIPSIVQKALDSFQCFLYVGKDVPVYKSRPWNDDDYYDNGKRIENLELLAACKSTELIAIDKIKLAMDSKLIQRPETIMFALAMCARQTKSKKLRTAAYYFLAEHCKEWKYFILFIKYASYLCKKEGKKTCGWGHGWKNAVNKWYLSQDARTLAELVLRHKGNYGWKHQDILKLSHPSTVGLEPEKRAIICYIIRGLKEAEKEYGSNPEAAKILELIRTVKKFKQCTQPNILIPAITKYGLTVDQVHPKMLKSKLVWSALLKNMDVQTLLKHLPKLMKNKIWRESTAKSLITSTLTDNNNLLWNNILTVDLLAVRHGFEKNLRDDEITSLALKSTICDDTIISKSKEPKKKYLGKPENARKKVPEKNSSEPPAKEICPLADMEAQNEIWKAISKAIEITRTNNITGSSDRSYLISARMPGRHILRIPWYDAGLALAYPLMCRQNISDDTVSLYIVMPQEQTGLTVENDENDTYPNMVTLRAQVRNEKIKLVPMPNGPLGCAMEIGKKYDVVINITNEPLRECCKIYDTMNTYKTSLEAHDTRLINIITNRRKLKLREYPWRKTLTISGFDQHVPRIIEAYLRGLF